MTRYIGAENLLFNPRQEHPFGAATVQNWNICARVLDTGPRASAVIFGRETVDSASDPASPVLTGYGNSAGSLGPGLTSESADAVRAVLRDDLPAGPQVRAPAGGAGLIRPAWTRGWGSRGPAASGCVPSLNLRKG